MSGAQRGELLNRVAWEHRSEGWGLLRKPSGNRCPAPQGVEVACDILVYAPTPWHFDVLIDSEGAATPTWGDVGPCDPNLNGCDMARFLAPIAPPGQPPSGVPTVTRMVGGDFDVNGQGDLLAQSSTGSVMLGLNSASGFQTETVFGSATAWTVVGVGNFDKVGHPDVVWQHPTGAVVLWALNSSTTPQAFYLFSGVSVWRVAAVADVDLDTNPDLIWQSPSGQVIVWFMQGQNVSSTQFLWSSSSEYRLAAAGDFNGDSYADIVWQHPGGQVVIWLMQGMTRLASPIVFNGTTPWQVVAASDLDANGRSDLVWRGPASHFVIWSMNGGAAAGYLYLSIGSQWQLSTSPPQ